MSKAIVNMTPNPSDIQTIHCSQGDTEAREWEFELHNNGEVIDPGGITEQMVFKSYKGGTEQILPENGAVLVTAPFVGDIKYQDATRTGQEFLYRESPTEEDGLAKIQTIYGNTLKWNQLIQNGNFADLSSWLFTDYATSVSDNTLTLTSSSTSQTANARQLGVNIPNGHKFIVLCDVKVSQPIFRIILKDSSSISNNFTDTLSLLNTWVKYERIGTTTLDVDRIYIYPNRDGVSGATCELKNFMIFDLTAMFGSTKADEIYAMEQAQSGSGIAYFRSLFPLPFYSYDSGSLLPFRGEGLKTVGKNLFDGVYNNLAFGSNTVIQSAGYRGCTFNVSSLKGKQITVSRADTTSNNRFRASFFSVEPQNLTPFERELNRGEQYRIYDSQLSFTLTVPNGANYLLLYISNNGIVANDLMIEIGSTVSDYEPYISSTLSLPIQEHFPNGMNGVNDVHDELRNDGTTLKMYMVNLGALNWIAEHEYASGQFKTGVISSIGIPIPAYNTNFICSKYENGGLKNYLTVEDKTIAFTNGAANNIIRVHDTSCASMTASEFKESLQNVYLCYELATYEEASFTTASLVTENGEVALANENGVLTGKCNSDVSADAGFIEGKIKLSDSDGDVYSNKIQIHVERMPE